MEKYISDKHLDRVDELLSSDRENEEKEHLEAVEILLAHPLLGLAWDAELDDRKSVSVGAQLTKIPELVGKCLDYRKRIIYEINHDSDDMIWLRGEGYHETRNTFRSLLRELRAYHKKNWKKLVGVLPATRMEVVEVKYSIRADAQQEGNRVLIDMLEGFGRSSVRHIY